MSLLIKGLGMPKLDENEERLWVPGWIEVGKDDKVIFCTGTHFDPNTIHSYAVEEVSPHGRLIDADRLMDVIEKNSYLLKGYYNSLENGMFLTGIKQAINEAPTIIEAEGVNE